MKRPYRWALFFLLASLATAAGTVEPAPAWHTGPVDFKKARRVPAFYCNARGMVPGTGHEQIPLSNFHRTGLIPVRMKSRSTTNVNPGRFLVPAQIPTKLPPKTPASFDLIVPGPTPAPNRGPCEKSPPRFRF